MKKLLACAIAVVLVLSFGVTALANIGVITSGTEPRSSNGLFFWVAEDGNRIWSFETTNSDMPGQGLFVLVNNRPELSFHLRGSGSDGTITWLNPPLETEPGPQCANVVVARETVTTTTITSATATGNAVRRPQGNTTDIGITVTATVVTTVVVTERFCNGDEIVNPALGISWEDAVPTPKVIPAPAALSIQHSNLRNQAVNYFTVTVGDYVFPIGIHRHGNTLTVQNAVINVAGMTPTTSGAGNWVPTKYPPCPAR